MKIQKHTAPKPTYIPRYAMTVKRSPFGRHQIMTDSAGKPVLKKAWPGRKQSKYDPQACDKKPGFPQ